MKASELAAKLMEMPDLEVGISKFGGDNRWQVNAVGVSHVDNSCDSILLGKDGDEFVLLEANE